MVSFWVKVTIPKKLFKDIHVKTAIAQAQRRQTEPDLMRLFNGTVEGWEHRPTFTSKQVINSKRISMTVGLYTIGKNTASRIYSMVNHGTPAHPINPKRGGFLRFQHGSGYRAATIPGQLFSHRATSSGPYISTNTVKHPGFEARNFDLTIAREYEQTFRDDMQDAINEAAKEYG